LEELVHNKVNYFKLSFICAPINQLFIPTRTLQNCRPNGEERALGVISILNAVKNS